MIQEQAFQEAIAALLELGYANGSRLSKSDVHYYMKDILENEEQYPPVYRFLEEKHIEIEGISASFADKAKTTEKALDISSLTDLDRKTYTMYLNDLKRIRKLSSTGREKLLQDYLKNRDNPGALVEQYLPLVLDILPHYLKSFVKLGDLLQEGNIGLMQGVYTYDDHTDFEKHLRTCISQAMENYIQAESASHQVSEHLLEQVNALERASRTLAEEYGREATLEELSAFLHLPEEEVKIIMKHSIDALNSGDGEDITMPE